MILRSNRLSKIIHAPRESRAIGRPPSFLGGTGSAPEEKHAFHRFADSRVGPLLWHPFGARLTAGRRRILGPVAVNCGCQRHRRSHNLLNLL